VLAVASGVAPAYNWRDVTREAGAGCYQLSAWGRSGWPKLTGEPQQPQATRETGHGGHLRHLTCTSA
jgi:hypothetical protein